MLGAFMIAACTYAASLGFEAISRFSALVFVLTVIGVFGIAVASANKFESINLFPFMQNDSAAVLKMQRIPCAAQAKFRFFLLCDRG